MSFEKFFSPKSVAIVGASQHKGKVGYEILTNLIKGKFPGALYPVNNKAEKIKGLKCYPDLPSIGEVPDLAIIIVPATVVPSVMEQCVKVGIKAVVIITAGFKEIGEEGRKLERQVAQIARRGNVRFIGPNCLGVISTFDKLNASFGGDLPMEGGTSYISQSGALLAAILDMANDQGIGLSKLVSIGNKADLNELDILGAMDDDPNTKVIAGYLESIEDGNMFARVAEEVSTRKPILLIKSGGTAAGAQAASSHTGSLAGGETAYEAVFAKAGIIRCKSIIQQFNYARAFANQPLPRGARVAVITNAGGFGIMAADAVEAHGLDFATLDDATKAKLAKKLPPAANVNNPVDVLGDALADRYEFALDVVLADENVDAVIVIMSPQAMTEPEKTAKAIVKIARQRGDKPVITSFMGASKVRGGIDILQKGGIPQYRSPEDSVDTLQVMVDYVRWCARPKRVVKLFPVNRRKVEKIIEKHLRDKSREIGESEAKEILEAYGFATPSGSVATSAEHAASIAQQVGFPVVMKIWSPDIIHKSDVGGVRVGLRTVNEVKDAFDLMMYRIPQKQPGANIYGVLVEKMATSGKEVILGMNRDPRFGPLMMFGMGGTMVEVLKDVSFYLAPVTSEEAKQMLKSTRTYQMLEGVRGDEGVDIDALA
ncbi:CoA-binding protein, partial [candidate division KSB1 bacterium]